MEAKAWKILRVFMASIDLICALGIAHPQPDLMSIARDNIGDDRTETTTAENCDAMTILHA